MSALGTGNAAPLSSYAEATRELQYQRIGTLYQFAILLSLIYLIPDYLLFGQEESWPVLLLCRLGIVGAATLGALINRKRLIPVAIAHPVMTAFWVTSVMVVTLGFVTDGAGGFLSPYFAASDMVFLVWCLVLVGGVRALALPALGLFAGFVALLAFLQGPALPAPGRLVGPCLVLFIAMAICVAGNEVIETLRRREFERQAELDEQHRALSTALDQSERTREKLVRTESLATLGEYIASIMHELRNPMAGVASVIEEVIAELRREAPEALAEPIGALVSSLDQQRRAARFIDSLMDLSRRTERYDEAINVNAAVADALGLLRVQFKRESIAFEDKLTPSLPPVRGNFAQLGQVLLNLGRNAAEAVAGRGEGRVVFETREAGAQVEIVCRDNGPGIAPETLPNLFDAFYTTKGVGEGTGLGLYLARRIVLRHGGTIEAANSPGGGAIFVIRLPAGE